MTLKEDFGINRCDMLYTQLSIKTANITFLYM